MINPKPLQDCIIHAMPATRSQPEADMSANQRKISFVILGLAFLLISFSLLNLQAGFPAGLLNILESPSILITDYTAVGGLAAASFNAGVMVLIYWVILRMLRAELNGMVLAGIFTVAGFAFFGKNPLNALPLTAGVYLFARAIGKEGSVFAGPMLFSTTAAPLVSQIAFGFDFGWIGIPAGIAAGLAAGFAIGALARHVYSLHHGYNLYNIGTTGGFITLIFFIFMRGFGLEIEPAFFWSTGYTQHLRLLFITITGLLLTGGLLLGGSVQGVRTLSTRSGRLPTDFVDLDGPGNALVNMALVGLTGLGYVAVVGGCINGPVMAGLLTMTGFGALGKNLRNILPIMLGVYLITIFKIWEHTDPGPLIAALFATSLAPIAGRFGFFAGILAGILHLPMVMHVGSIHGFMNLYNNGFAAGLAVMVMIGILSGIKPELSLDE